ncbi:MAG: hypothetical protein DBY09_02450 [Selenomonadales bacterium]|nr:MAG: hypothetical protein DBY09_02450 [Selenomonadales bacterium]
MAAGTAAWPRFQRGQGRLRLPKSRPNTAPLLPRLSSNCIYSFRRSAFQPSGFSVISVSSAFPS